MSGTLRMVGARRRAAMASALPFIAAACSFPDIAFVGDDAQPAATNGTGPEMEPVGVDAGDSSDPQGVGAPDEAGAAHDSPSGPPGKAHDAGAFDAGPRGDGGVDCLCDASQMYPAHIDCSAVQLGGIHLLCGDFAGFAGSDPGCGHPGSFVTCTAGLVGLACTAGTPSVVVQQCH